MNTHSTPATAVNSKPSWRDVLKIHPAAELFPRMSPDELRALGEDIKKNGLKSPVALWSPGTRDKDQPKSLLDGRNRLDALEAVGLSVVATGRDGKSHFSRQIQGKDYLRDLPVTQLYGKIETWSPGKDGVAPNIDPYAYVISANIHRRHLTAEQKRELIAKLLKAQPEKSDRQIAKTVKASPTFVGKVRAEKEATGDVSTVDTRTDTKGRKQPARKPPPASTAAPKPSPAAEPRRPKTKAEYVLAEQMVDAGYKALARKFHPDTGGSDDAFRQLNELREGFKRYLIPEYYRHVKLLKSLNNLGPDPLSELERLRKRVEELQADKRRLEIKIKGCESEIEELKAQLKPADDGLDIPASLRRAAP